MTEQLTHTIWIIHWIFCFSLLQKEFFHNIFLIADIPPIKMEMTFIICLEKSKDPRSNVCFRFTVSKSKTSARHSIILIWYQYKDRILKLEEFLESILYKLLIWQQRKTENQKSKLICSVSKSLAMLTLNTGVSNAVFRSSAFLLVGFTTACCPHTQPPPPGVSIILGVLHSGWGVSIRTKCKSETLIWALQETEFLTSLIKGLAQWAHPCMYFLVYQALSPSESPDGCRDLGSTADAAHSIHT